MHMPPLKCNQPREFLQQQRLPQSNCSFQQKQCDSLMKKPFVESNNPPLSSVNGTVKPKHNIVIIGDSHARDIARLWSSELDNNEFNVLGVCKPNATLDSVLWGSDSLLASLTSKDFLVIMGGVNNAISGQRVSDESFKKIISYSIQTNVILPYVPYWKRRPILNNFIHDLNITFYENFADVDVTLIDSNAILTKDMFVGSGLHLNVRGKRKMISLFSDIIINIVRSSACTNIFSFASHSAINFNNLIQIECGASDSAPDARRSVRFGKDIEHLYDLNQKSSIILTA